MKKIFVSLMVCMLCFSPLAFAQDEEAVKDSISIDDMDPTFYTEEEEDEEKSSMGMYVAIGAGVLVLAGVGVVVAKKNKK